MGWKLIKKRLPNSETKESLIRKLGDGPHIPKDVKDITEETMDQLIPANYKGFDPLKFINEVSTASSPKTGGYSGGPIIHKSFYDTESQMPSDVNYRPNNNVTIDEDYIDEEIERRLKNKNIMTDEEASSFKNNLMQQVVSLTKDTVTELTVKYKNALEIIQIQREKIEVLGELQNGDLSGLFDMVKHMQLKTDALEKVVVEQGLMIQELKRMSRSMPSSRYYVKDEAYLGEEELKEAHRFFSNLGSSASVKVPVKAPGFNQDISMYVAEDGELTDTNGVKYISDTEGHIVPKT